jgi:hypothetical protein
MWRQSTENPMDWKTAYLHLDGDIKNISRGLAAARHIAGASGDDFEHRREPLGFVLDQLDLVAQKLVADYHRYSNELSADVVRLAPKDANDTTLPPSLSGTSETGAAASG